MTATAAPTDLDVMLDAALDLVAAVNAVNGPVLALVGASLPGASDECRAALLALDTAAAVQERVLALVGRLDS